MKTKTGLIILKFIATLAFTQNVAAFERCHYQHTGVRSGIPYNALKRGDFIGDFQFAQKSPDLSIIGNWNDPVMPLKYTIEVTEGTESFCTIEARVDLLQPNKIPIALGSTVLMLSKECGSEPWFHTLIYYPDTMIEDQLKNRVENKGPVYTGVQLACQ